MRIQTFSFADRTTGWELQPLSLNQLTLLVGASGVGKTRILNSILDLKRIVKGESLKGVKWYIEFLSSGGTLYIWEGEFEDTDVSFKNDENHTSGISIITESVKRENKLIVTRDHKEILFNNKKTVKLSSDQSILYLLREEEQIKEAAKEFEKIIFPVMDIKASFSSSFDKDINKYSDIGEVRNLPIPLDEKLYFACKKERQLFDSIVNSFIDIFPSVEEVRIEPVPFSIETAVKHFTLEIQIKEMGVADWISNISSGMLKTLVHIAQLHLCADSSLILIDEFENSLGINCIDELTSSILSSERGLQFIITSHHPYIINNINHTNWKIVTRKGSVVTARDAAEFHFDKSKHQAFTQLINLDIYSEGVES
ncbi:AAA family ATPase [Candidatus Electrothrix sp.]|uniref:AAA family ATPase n=1 Tax=Candidatus Electrothrix sp. TaxID=2170559 RepID=UPI00405689B8